MDAGAQDFAGRKFALARIRDELEELKNNARIVVARDEGAAPLMADDQIFRLHLVERFARGARRNPEIGCDFELARDRLPRLPGAIVDARDEHVTRLPV